MRVGVGREQCDGERRVAATPETVHELAALGLEIFVERGAGAQAGYPDEAFKEAGAAITAELVLESVDVLLHVRPFTPDAAASLRPGTITIGFASPGSELPTVRALAEAGVTSFAMELIPRISRAQSMDALSSQSLVSGYRAVLEAAVRYPRFFPLYMTAAGTIPPARVLVLGAGVAGLQAIGTAKRLGARVSANDVRAASADEVASMGGTFINLDLDAAAEGPGGYARELGEDRAQRQRGLLAPHVAATDVLITTAAIPGRAAPLLVTTDMVAGMRAGSVVVDLAAESGGNVEGIIAGQDVQLPVVGGFVTLVGMKDAASAMPSDASRLYARNVSNLLALMTADGRATPDFDDEVISGACLTCDGTVRHPATAAALAAEVMEGEA
ncbi:Re/Si-specific NAD(P)(+) transhydrogenase subunit alpha [Arthrobacter oryzae]|uniref:proton-translocating NAD(P)(+) transhydrogenase n=1 Tax=Arthrobacter oryzae TaxID=409290 RepID=A0A3N0BYK7_9MICC|nr:Re/Si-specific NAD(P)(+) transhydrogenase subunit alpha [Arthrobacter oryzae]RNL55013.1 Re/Si-specific NAD(P)(+) transhydrogenase subunit alpha [Arthrobacter oryzae]